MSLLIHAITHTTAGKKLAEPVVLELNLSDYGLAVEIVSGASPYYQGIELTTQQDGFLDLCVDDAQQDKEYAAHTFDLEEEE